MQTHFHTGSQISRAVILSFILNFQRPSLYITFFFFLPSSSERYLWIGCFLQMSTYSSVASDFSQSLCSFSSLYYICFCSETSNIVHFSKMFNEKINSKSHIKWFSAYLFSSVLIRCQVWLSTGFCIVVWIRKVQLHVSRHILEMAPISFNSVYWCQ